MSSQSALSITCGWTHTIVIPGNGSFVAGWGLGPEGQLSIRKGFTEFGAQILEIPHDWFGSGNGRTFADLGDKHTALICDGDLYTLGSNEDGRLGHEKGRFGKVEFKGDVKAQLVACGAAFNIAVVGTGCKQCYSWGVGIFGNLGIGKVVQKEEKPVPFFVLDHTLKTPKSIHQISCGSEHVLALCKDGQVYSWGRGTNGRLGHGNSKQKTVPTLIEDLVVSSQERVIQVAAGDAHSMALNIEGRIYSWGMGSYGRLGLGSVQNVHSPRLVTSLGKKFATHIDCHTFHSLAVVRGIGYTLYTWGGGQYGKLGHRSTENCLLPTPVTFFDKKAVIIASCGLEHTACITKDGKIYAWGYCLNRRCGFDNVLHKGKASYIDEPRWVRGLDPKQIVGFQGNEQKVASIQEARVKQVACGVKHSIARLGDEDSGYLMAWGSNECGQMGTGPHRRAFKPIKVFVSLDNNYFDERITDYTSIVQVACGDFHTIAVSKNGNVFSWGRNNEGQLGLGDTKNRNKPILVDLLQGEEIMAVSAGGDVSAAVPSQPADNDPRFPFLFLWGNGCRGQLGFGREVTQLSSPKQLQLKIPPVYKEKHSAGMEVALGRMHTLILVHHIVETGKRPKLRSDLYASGEGRHGKLGLNDFDDRWEFEKYGVPVEKEKKHRKIEKIFAGPNCSFAVFQHEKHGKNHVLWAWGSVNGVFQYDVNNPKVVDLTKLLSRANPFGSTEYRVWDCAPAENHTLLVLENGDKRLIVVAFGLSRYGKLGIGNIVHYIEGQSNKDDDVKTFTEVKDKAYPPLVIPSLSNIGITYVAARQDHSIAASENNVFVWGNAGDGRLGLGEFSSSRSETVPVSIREFDRNQSNLSESEEEEEEVVNTIGKDVVSRMSKTRGDPMTILKYRLEAIRDTIHLEDRICDQIAEYKTIMKAYSIAFEKYADQTKLIRLAIFYRLLQYHRSEVPDQNVFLKKLDTISYQPHPENSDTDSDVEDMPNKNDRLSPYELNPLELLVARIHMAPSEFFNKIYEPERKEWKKGDAYAATSVTASRKLIKEKELFVDLVFSVYDVHDDVHFQRFLLFLKLVLQHHNDTSKQDHDFMPPDSVEWMLFCRGLSAGKGRARLRASFQKALSGIRLDGEQKNDVWSYINNPEADYDTLVGYVRQMNNAANRFVNVISKKFVERIMDATNEVVDVLYDVLERHYRKFMLGELLIKAIIQVVLDDLDYFYQSDKMMDKGILRFVLLHLKHQKLKTSSWRDDRKNHKEPTLRAAKEHLLDITKNHSEEVRNRIKANTETILPDLTLFKLKRLYEGNSEEEFEEVWRSPFTIFLDYIKTVRTKLMDEKKEKNNPREEMNNNLLTQFLKDRSTFSPCVLQISLRSIHRFLMLRTPYEEKSPHKEIFWKALIRYEMGYIKTRKQINQIIEEIFETRKERTWMSNWQAINEGVCTNVRLDLFMADQERPIVNNRQCFNIWTPRYSNVNEVAEGNDSKRSQLGKPVNTVILSEEDCVKLYFTLKDDDFQKIVEKNESQNAWVMIIKGLSKLREGALEDSNNKLVQHLEWCRRTVRKLVTKDKKTIIKLGVSIARRGQDPIELANKVEGIPQDALDPGTLMEKLRGIDTKTLQSNIKLQRNLRIITKVIKHVKSKTSEVTKEAKDLIEIFRTLSRSTEDEKTKQNLAVFYGIWRNKNDHSLVRKYKATHVSMIRGNILCKSYLEMTKKGLLLPVQLKDQSDTLQTKGGKEWTKLGDDYEESSYGCCMGVDPTIRRFIEFKKGLQFVFLTSERPDLVHLNILYVNPKTTRHDQITANERNLILQLEFTLRGGELWVYEVGKPRLPMEEQQSNKLLSIEYNPLGDDVPIRKKVLFDFKNLSLYKFLKSNELHRPNKVFDVEQLLSKNGLQDVLLDVLV